MVKIPKELLQASMVGIQLVVSTIIGGAVGYGLDSAMDKWFGIRTFPVLFLIFLILGIVAGFRELFRRATRKENESGKKDL
ncbi:MAG: AtpZ/AtpI family protein [Thermodesulfovibrionales bacterium]|nr:AtpZ/AtpI family protein [Thermodesulfovibrionales bacterium]